MEEDIDNLLAEEAIIDNVYFHVPSKCGLMVKQYEEPFRQGKYIRLKKTLCIKHNVLAWECGWEIYHHDGEPSRDLSNLARSEAIKKGIQTSQSEQSGLEVCDPLLKLNSNEI